MSSWADIVKKEPIIMDLEKSYIQVLSDTEDKESLDKESLDKESNEINEVQEVEIVKEVIVIKEELTEQKDTFFKHGDQHTKKISKNVTCVFVSSPDSTKYLLLTDFGKYHWNKGTDTLIPFSGTYVQWCKHLGIKRGKCIGFHKINRFCGGNITIISPGN